MHDSRVQKVKKQRTRSLHKTRFTSKTSLPTCKKIIKTVFNQKEKQANVNGVEKSLCKKRILEKKLIHKAFKS